MKIEVFKEFKNNVRLFDAIDPNYITWLFDSENHRDGPTTPAGAYENPYNYFNQTSFSGQLEDPGHDNQMAPGPQPENTIYFDNDEYYTKFVTTQKNVVIDYRKPQLISWNGSFTAFKDGGNWTAELIIKDDSGIDGDAFAFAIRGNSGTESAAVLGEVASIVSKRGDDEPYYNPVLTTVPATGLDGVDIRIQQSDIDKTMFRVTITIDPNKLKTCLEADGHGFMACDADAKFKYVLLNFTLIDIAGNVMEPSDEFAKQAFVYFDISREELLKDVQKLTLSPADIYPPNLFIDEDMIGHMTIIATNPNETLYEYGFVPKIGLLSDSVGFLSGDPDQHIDGADQLVDGISNAGYVKAYAYLDGSMGAVTCSIGDDVEINMMLDQDLASELRALTYVEGEWGPFIVECSTNTRKIDVDPFVPSCLKHEGFYGLCKHLERYLNTMYTPMGSDCRIGVLEKIDRISHFKDPDSCEPELLTKFAEDHGSEFNFNRAQVEKAANVLLAHSDIENLDSRDLIESIYRRFYGILPYIDRWKGTTRGFELLYRVLGIDARIYPLWEGPTHDMVREDRAKEDYDLTAHLEIELKSDVFNKREMTVISDFLMSAVKSVLPINRVISDVVMKDEISHSEDERDLRFNFVSLDYELKPTKLEGISFWWYLSDSVKSKFNQITDRGTYCQLEIPMYVTGSKASHTTAESAAGWPVPNNCTYYFKQYENTARTYGSNYKTLFLTFAGAMNGQGGVQIPNPERIATNVELEIQSVSQSHGNVIIKIPKTSANLSQINKYNSNIMMGNRMIVASFKFSRAVDNYCESIPYEEFNRGVFSDTPFYHKEG